MTDTLLNISGKLDRKKIDIIGQLQSIFESHQKKWFIVGALARDIILEHYYSCVSARATEDIDLAVAVDIEDDFSTIRQALIMEGNIVETDLWHRLISKERIILDILPFNLEAGKMDLYYPAASGASPITTMGFAECYHNTVRVILDEVQGIEVNVSSLAGLMILKIIAWDENIARRGKDAVDMFFIMKNYLQAGVLDRLTDETAHILEEYDYLNASAIYLGLDMGKMVTSNTMLKIMQILKSNEGPSENKIVTSLFSEGKQNFTYDQACFIMQSLMRGLMSAIPAKNEL